MNNSQSSQDPRGSPPPPDYLERLAESVLPVYREAREHWTSDLIPRMRADLAEQMGDLTRIGRSVHGTSHLEQTQVPIFDHHTGNRYTQSLKLWEELPTHPRLFLYTYPGVQEALVEAMEAGDAHSKVPYTLHQFLDASLLTLDLWVREPAALKGRYWHRPYHKWPNPFAETPADDPSLPLGDRAEHYSSAGLALDFGTIYRDFMRHDGGPKGSILGVAGSTALPPNAQDPEAVRRLLWALGTLQEYGRYEQVRQQREELEALVGRLFAWRMDMRDRRARERAMSFWLDELIWAELATLEAEHICTELGVEPNRDGSEFRIPSGGRPYDWFSVIVWELFLQLHPAYPSGRVTWNSPEVRKSISEELRKRGLYVHRLGVGSRDPIAKVIDNGIRRDSPGGDRSG